MAGPRICRSPRRNPLPGGKNELVGGLQGASNKSSNTSTHSPAISWALTPAPLFTNKLFKRFMKAYLKSYQGPSQPPKECKRPFKAKVSDVYYGKSHMYCYHFCQQCEDHFEISWATGTNQTLFATSFLCENISIQWMQFKRHRDEEVAPITWAKFKAFPQKNLGESKSFVDNIWKKLKKDSQYQLEEVYDWASHLKHLQSILIEFDPVAALTKSTMVRYFEKGLKPSIKAKMDQNTSHLDNYEELVAKLVRAEAKAGLQPSSYIQETNQQVS